MKWISLLTLVPTLALALPVEKGAQFRSHLNSEYVVRGNFDKSDAKLIRKLGKSLSLVQSRDKDFINSKNNSLKRKNK